MAKTPKDGEGSIEDLRKRAAQGSALIAQNLALFPEAKGLAKQDRRSSRGKMGLVEAKALRGVVGAIDLEPAIFASLADEDEGHDPNKVETDLVRDRFDRHEIYTLQAEAHLAAAKVFTDAALANGALVTLATQRQQPRRGRRTRPRRSKRRRKTVSHRRADGVAPSKHGAAPSKHGAAPSARRCISLPRSSISLPGGLVTLPGG